MSFGDCSVALWFRFIRGCSKWTFFQKPDVDFMDIFILVRSYAYLRNTIQHRWAHLVDDILYRHQVSIIITNSISLPMTHYDHDQTRYASLVWTVLNDLRLNSSSAVPFAFQSCQSLYFCHFSHYKQEYVTNVGTKHKGVHSLTVQEPAGFPGQELQNV